MTYTISNPFVPDATTYINTDTGKVFHVFPGERGKIRSEHPVSWWMKYVRVPLDPDFEMDEGL